jgi:hypothetical protein
VPDGSRGKNAGVERLIEDHRALLLKHARRHVRAAALLLTPEDVARELELTVLQLGKEGRIREDTAADLLFRAIVRHAAGRVKRRRTLIDQIAAGDDLLAVSRELAAVDADLPAPPEPPSREANAAHATLGRLKGAVGARDALVLALLIEDELAPDEIASTLALTEADVDLARERILVTAAELGIEPIPETREPARASQTEAPRREARLRQLAEIAQPPSGHTAGEHVDAPLVRLIRDGDLSDDLSDAVMHVALCADCRAHLTEGELEERRVTVLAIEAPPGHSRELARAAEGAKATLVERGAGRWTAVVDAERADQFRGELQREDSSVVTRLAVATPVRLIVPSGAAEGEPPKSQRRGAPSFSHLGAPFGTAAAEVQAWAQIARVPRERTPAPHPGWTAFAILTVLAAMGIAYILATR